MFDGAGFANTSVMQTLLPNPANAFGFFADRAAGTRVADDFHLNGPGPITVTEIEVFAYEVGSTTASTITGLFVEITAGDPSLGAPPVPGSPGFGVDLFTAGSVVNNSWSRMYRVMDTALGSAARPVMAVRCALPAPIVLAPGFGYWLSYELVGTGASGPVVPVVTIPNELNVGNAKQRLANGAWAVLNSCVLPGCGVAIPFRLHGAGQTRYSIARGVPACGPATLDVRAAGNLGGLIRMNAQNATSLFVLGVGIGPVVTPVCWNGAAVCSMGHAWNLLTNFGTGWTLPLPVVPAAFGLPIVCQGAELLGPAACTAPGAVTLTNSTIVTVQY
jgi:hypothetical protein